MVISTQTGNGTVYNGYAKFEAGINIGQGLTIGIVKVYRQLIHIYFFCNCINELTGFNRGADSNSVTE